MNPKIQTVKIQNVSKEIVAFTGIPAINPGEIVTVSQEQADYMLLNDSMKVVSSEKEEKDTKKNQEK